MPAEPFTHLVFVDFENVTDINLGAVEGKPVHVTLLIGRNQRRLELTLVRQIHRLASQVDLVEVGASGHNALDLTLAYYLGQAVHRQPHAQFCVVSKDRDFEPMIHHARGQQVDVARFDSFDALPFLEARRPAPPPAPRPSPPAARGQGTSGRAAPAPRSVGPSRSLANRRARVIARLKDPSYPNRPATRNGLVAHIKTTLGKESSDEVVADILRELVDGRLLSIGADEKIIYPNAPKSERRGRARDADARL